MGKEKKVYLSFYIEKIHLKTIDAIIADPNNIFDDRSTLIRYALKMQLPTIVKDLNDIKNEGEEKL